MMEMARVNPELEEIESSKFYSRDGNGPSRLKTTSRRKKILLTIFITFIFSSFYITAGSMQGT
jgi:hypothetical protein